MDDSLNLGEPSLVTSPVHLQSSMKCCFHGGMLGKRELYRTFDFDAKTSDSSASRLSAVLNTKLYVAILILALSLSPTRGTRNKNSWKESYGETNQLCQPDHLTVYRVILSTFWNEKNFPKQFPYWRPPAQWTKLIGRSHDKSYVLFRLGRKASDGLKLFAETGRSDALDAQSQGEGGVYDEFNAPPITTGEGRTEAEFFVDGNHSRVSLVSKMIPSPDWFIGIDGFDLCVNGNWLDGITIEGNVVDAGTDNGFTFTSPDWPTEPRGVTYRITQNYPKHPASSFYYPELKKLPTIALFQLIKIKEYELSNVFHHSEDPLAKEVLKMEHISYVYEESVGKTMKPKKNPSLFITESPKDHAELDHHSQAHSFNTKHNKDANGLIEHTTVNPSPSTTINEEVLKNIFDVYSGKARNKNKKFELDDDQNNVLGAEIQQQKPKAKKLKDVRKIRPPRDCQVGGWAEWTSCSKACDIGESTRYRKVIHHARRGGQPCPPLSEKKWCGSARSCNRRYFNWSR